MSREFSALHLHVAQTLFDCVIHHVTAFLTCCVQHLLLLQHCVLDVTPSELLRCQLLVQGNLLHVLQHGLAGILLHSCTLSTSHKHNPLR
jgi:hypothetical protein